MLERYDEEPQQHDGSSAQRVGKCTGVPLVIRANTNILWSFDQSTGMDI